MWLGSSLHNYSQLSYCVLSNLLECSKRRRFGYDSPSVNDKFFRHKSFARTTRALREVLSHFAELRSAVATFTFQRRRSAARTDGSSIGQDPLSFRSFPSRSSFSREKVPAKWPGGVRNVNGLPGLQPTLMPKVALWALSLLPVRRDRHRDV